MATMYTCMVFGLAELSSTISTAGGGYGFARRALGPWGGFLTGTAILIEYAIAPAAIVVFIGGYVESWTCSASPPAGRCTSPSTPLFVGVHLVGVGEALKVIFAITAIAVVALLAFVLGMIPKFDSANLTNIAPDARRPAPATSCRSATPGIWAAFPFAIWFFLAIEGVPLAAEETRNPKRDMPRGPDRRHGDPARVRRADAHHRARRRRRGHDPGLRQPAARGDRRRPSGDGSFLGDFVNYVGLAGLIASFFSIIFAYSRQLFALSRAGYLPRRCR